MKRLVVFACTLLSLQLYSSLVHADLKTEFQSAHASFLSFVDEQGGDFDSAWEQFEQLDNDYPDHPAVQMYYGSLEAIKADQVRMPWSKMKWVERGLDRIDRALTLLAPEHQTEQLVGIPVALDCRIAATQTLLSVPGFLNRTGDARDVFADLLNTTDLDSLPLVVQQRIFQLGADIARKTDDKQQEDKWLARLEALADSAQ